MRELRFGAVALSDVASGLTAYAVGIGLAFAGFGVWSLVWMECARRAVRAVVLVIGAGWRPTLKIGRADVLDLMHFNATTLGVRLLTQIDSAVPKFFVGMLLGAQALGYLNIAYRIFQQLTSLVLAPFTAVVLPVASAVQRDRVQLHRILGATTRVATMFAFPIFIGAAAAAPIVFPLLLGAKWTPAILPAQILLLTALKSPAAAFNGGVLRGSGKPGLHLGIIAFGLVLTLILTPLAAPFGLAAVCAAVMVRGMIQWGVGAQLVERAVGYPAMQQFVVGWESFLAAAVMGATMLALQETTLMQLSAPVVLVCLISIGALVYVGVLAVLAPKLVRMLISLATALLKWDRGAVSRLLRAA
jgi:O-antigen/teichoic acid export membrane protein